MNWIQKDLATAIGNFFLAILNDTGSFIHGFAAGQTTSPSLTINVGAGQIYQQAALDVTPFGSLDLDNTVITQQGVYAGGQVTLDVSNLLPGQSKWALVEIAVAQVDDIRPGDPTGGTLLFFNADDEELPLQGPTGNSETSNTRRKEVANVTVKYGAVSSGSPVPPAADAGYVPAYLILLSYGQATITTGQILTAGDAAYSGYPEAPFLRGILQSHHGGVAGQAPKINLTGGAEVQGVAEFANLPVTNSAPPTVGGHTISAPKLSVCWEVDANPNGNVAGQEGDFVVWTALGFLFRCTTSGSAGSAVWEQINGGEQVAYFNNWGGGLTPQVGFTYLVDTTGQVNPAVTAPLAANLALSPIGFLNIGDVAFTLNAAGGENLIIDGVSQASVVIAPGEGYRFGPRAGTGLYKLP